MASWLILSESTENTAFLCIWALSFGKSILEMSTGV